MGLKQIGVSVVRTETGSTWRLLTRLQTLLTSFILLLAIATGNANAKQDYSGIVMDAKTGKILYSHRADERAYPASLTKMMTLYMVFDAIESGKMSKSTRIRFSNHAASMQPSKLGVKAGSTISAEQAIYALVTKSANDAAAAVGEHIGGTESKFAEMMTAKARSLGMKNTTFRNASGLPDSRQVTSAKDMALLGIALREHFPQHYRYFSTQAFKFGSKTFGNHNKLLGKIRGVDGIKTGYTRDSGFNLVTSVDDKGRSIVAVVMGGKTSKSRNAQMTNLIRKYLPKASTGRDKMIVAKGPTKSLLASLLKIPAKKAPVPEQRPQIDPSEPVVIASAAGTPQVLPTTRPINDTDTTTTAAIVPSQSVGNGEPVGDADEQPFETARSGWHVQIAAMPSQENALNYLEGARAKLPSLLAGVTNYTESVSKNGETLYRARFAGFQSKDAAWGACAQLKKQKYSCLALEQ
jgi:D-alanyl-D-alanine carboxypeptidase